MADRTVGSGKTYSTVAAAISASSSGDRIILFENFNETGLTLPSGVDLFGDADQDSNGVVSDATGTVLTLGGDNEIGGVRISSSHAGSIALSAVNKSGIIVFDCALSANTDTIGFTTVTATTLTRVLFDDYEFDGVLVNGVSALTFNDCIVRSTAGEDIAPIWANSWIALSGDDSTVEVNNLDARLIKAASTQHNVSLIRTGGADTVITINGASIVIDSSVDSTDAAVIHRTGSGIGGTVNLTRVNAEVISGGTAYGCYSLAASGTTALNVTASTGVDASPSAKWDTTNLPNRIIPPGIGLPQKQLVGATESG